MAENDDLISQILNEESVSKVDVNTNEYDVNTLLNPSDDANNILKMKHVSSVNNWTRNYNYDTNSNKLLSTQAGNQTYKYSYHPKHGFKWGDKPDALFLVYQQSLG